MPVSGNGEPGVLSGQGQVQPLPKSFNYSSAIPIKKRRFPIIQSPPPPEENPSCSEDKRQEPKIPDHVPPLVASGRDVDSPSQSDLTKNSSSVVTDSKFECSASKIQDVKPSINLGPTDGSGGKFGSLSSKESSEPAGVRSMAVKQEIVSEQSEDRCKLELSTNSKKTELLLNPKGQFLAAISEKSGKPDSTLLSLSSRKETLPLQEKENSTISVGCQVSANRSSWDLNTTMDEWEGSTSNDSFVKKSADIGGLSNKTNSGQDPKSSWAMAGGIGLSLNKERGMNERSSYSYDSASYSSQKNKPDDSLGLSLAMPGRELNANAKSCLSEKSDSISVGPKLNLPLKTKVVNFASPKAVKSEPVDENSKRDSGVGSSSSSKMSLLKLTSVKRELVEKKQSLETVLPTTSISSGKIVDHSILVKSESVENNKENDSRLPRSDGRVMQHQESSASSSPLPTVLTPQSSCPSRLLNSSELTISEELSNSVHSGDVKPCNTGNSNVEHSEKCILKADENPLENNNKDEAHVVDMDISEETPDKGSLKSDGESFENRVGQKPRKKEDGEFEEGEVQESLRRLAEAAAIVKGETVANVKMVECHTENLQPFVSAGVSGSDFGRKATITDNLDETHSEHIKECVAVGYEHCVVGNSLQKSADPVLESSISVSVGPEKRLDLPGQKDLVECAGKEVNHETGTGISDCVTDEVVKEICSAKEDSTSPGVEASTSDHDVAKDSNNSGNKSRIINLPRASGVTTPPSKTRSIPDRLISRNWKGRYDFDGEMRPRWKRDETYNDGFNKFSKDKVHDQSFRNSRPSFMLGKGRISGRFGPLRNEWDSNREFVSEGYNGPPDYRVARHNKHSSSVDDEFEYNNGYGIGSDNTMGSSSGRRKVMNDDRFMRQFPDEVINNPVYNNRPQAMYDEIDVRGNRNFSRKGYSQIRSKSPIRSRTRSPSPWPPSRRRRSPDELTQHNRSPGLYRMRRTRSPCFRDDGTMVRRRGSPHYAPRHHNNEFREMESGREHLYPRSNRRSPPPGRGFPRNARRGDGLDSRERDEAGIDERRKFIEGRGHFRPFQQQGYNGENENMRFYVNDGPRPSRYCPDGNMEFFEKNNMREGGFNGRMNHQSLDGPKRIRNIEEQQDGNYGSGSRVWHDDGFADKRRRF